MNTLTNILYEKSALYTSKNYALYDKALRMAMAISNSTKEGDVILLAKKSGEDLFAAFLGAIFVKRIPLVIQRPSPKVHQTFFEKRMTDLKSQVNVALCFCEEADNNKYQPFFKVINSLNSDARSILIMPKKDEVAFLQMSSGTTGISKICAITHGQIVKHCITYGKTIGMNSTKSVVSWLPLYHDMGLVAAFLLPLIHDAEFHIIDPFDWLMQPKTLLEAISKYKGTHCWMPSFAFNYLSKKVPINSLPGIRLDSLEKVISCSEPTFADDLNNFKTAFAPLGLNPDSVCVCYALAENTFAVSQSEGVKDTTWKSSTYTSCGKIIPEVQVKIVKGGTVVTGSDDGTVMIQSPFMPITNKLTNGYYDTGDIGFIHEGELYIIGREKDMFVSYGVNIYPEMIEHCVSTVDGVVPGRVVCFGDFSKDLGTNRVVVLSESEDPKNNKLRIELSSIIKEEFNITAIVMLVAPGTLIKTSSGKFCRIKNKEQYAKNNVRPS